MMLQFLKMIFELFFKDSKQKDENMKVTTVEITPKVTLVEITIDQYFMGRREKYPTDYLPEYEVNAKQLLAKVNPLLKKITQLASYVDFELHPENKSIVSSGWRPPSVNANTPNSALKSKHMTCHAVDIYDPDGDIDQFLLDNESILAEFGLSMEHPSATKGWCHLQSIPPKSGKLIFYP